MKKSFIILGPDRNVHWAHFGQPRILSLKMRTFNDGTKWMRRLV